MVDFSETFFYSDQPATCPICGSRTEIILDLAHSVKQIQVHICRSQVCLNEFIILSEENFIS